MELKEIILTIKKNIIYIAVLTVVGVIIGFSSTGFFSSGFQHTKSYFLTDPAVEAEAGDLRSENYFQQEKARSFTDTAIAVLSSFDFQSEVVTIGDSLVVRKVAPQVIRLTYASPHRDESFSNIKRTIDHFNSKIAGLSESSPASQLKPIGANGAPSYSAASKTTLALAGAVFGFLFALLIVGSKNYFKI